MLVNTAVTALEGKLMLVIALRKQELNGLFYRGSVALGIRGLPMREERQQTEAGVTNLRSAIP